MKCIALCILSFVLISNAFAADSSSSTAASTSTGSPSSDVTPSPSSVPSSSTSPPEPAPEPIIKPQLLKFNITDATNKDLVCALFEFDVTIRLLPKPDDHENATTFFLLSTTTSTSESACSANVTTLQLSLNGTTDRVTLELEHSDKKYHLGKINLQIGDVSFEATSNLFENIDDNKSYLCQSGSVYKLNSTNPKSTAVAHLIVNNLKVDAFRTIPKDNQFRQAMQCESDYPTNDFVPLAVGCALISLVLIVLIAYIVGRRRSKRLAYTSV